MANVDDFIRKLKQIPNKVKQEKVFVFGPGRFLVKTKNIEDFLAVVYKAMPDGLRLSRKNKMKTSFPSLGLLDRLDKLFLSKSFLNKMGLAVIDMNALEDLLKKLCAQIADDEMKLKSMIENQ